MAKLALFDEVQKRWVPFDKDTELQVSYLSPEDGRELSRDVDKLTARSGGDRSVIWNTKLGERVLHGWRHITIEGHPGLTMPDGAPIAFSPETRKKLMAGCREISIFVNETCVDPAVFLEARQEEARREEGKND